MNLSYPQKADNCRGFTLIELMVVIVILGILAGLIVPRIMGRPEQAKQLKAKMQIESIGTALKLYKLDREYRPWWSRPPPATFPKTGARAATWKKARCPKIPGAMSSSI